MINIFYTSVSLDDYQESRQHVSNLIGNISYFATLRFSWVFKDQSIVRNGGQKYWKIFASVTQFLTSLRKNALLLGECCELRRRRYKLWTLVTITTWFECTFTRMWTRRDYFGDDVLNLDQRLRTSSPRNRRWRPSWRVCRFRCKQKARVAHALRSRTDSHIKSQKKKKKKIFKI